MIRYRLKESVEAKGKKNRPLLKLVRVPVERTTKQRNDVRTSVVPPLDRLGGGEGGGNGSGQEKEAGCRLSGWRAGELVGRWNVKLTVRL